MPISFIFWLCMFLYVIFGAWGEYTPGQPYPYMRLPRHLFIILMLGLLGWRVFGSAIK